MLAPYSTVELPIYKRPDRFTRKFTAFVEDLSKNLGLKLGLEDLEYRNIYEDTEQKISLAKSELKSSQYIDNSEDFFDTKYVIYFFIMIAIIYYFTRGKK